MIDIKRNVCLAIFLILLLMVASCAPVSSPPEATAVPTWESPTALPEISTRKLSIAAGSPTDERYLWGSALATAVTQTIPHTEMSVKTTSSRMEDLKLLLNGQADLAFAYDYHVVLANQGNLMQAFPDAPIETLSIKCGVEVDRPTFPDYSQPARLVLPLFEEPLQLITTEATGITTINDLRGRRISISPPDSVSVELAGFVLEALGINPLTIETFTTDEATIALGNGEIDAVLWSGRIPSPEINAAFSTATSKMVIIPIEAAEAAQIMQAYPGIFHRAVIPAGTYAGLEAEINTLAVTFVLAALEDFPTDLMTELVSMLLEGDPGSKLTQDETIRLTPKSSLSQLNIEVRAYLHPGALAYFAQHGLLEP